VRAAASRRGWYRRGGKRVVDLVVGLAALVALSPVLLILVLAVRMALGRPVLFRQARTGLGGRPFDILKIRTMRAPLGLDGRPRSEAERLSAFGRWVRRTSLDELPEFWNVVRGDMSLVGPRPLLAAYQSRYSPEQARRHEVRPGVTGWAQVNGRNATTWPERFRMDVWYVDNVSLRLDLRILARTVAAVMSGEGVSAAEHVTMPEFRGEQ
jgi:lipopolysaccharide/colanic/teichoic acid biosynthesis glycosyltransferase